LEQSDQIFTIFLKYLKSAERLENPSYLIK